MKLEMLTRQEGELQNTNALWELGGNGRRSVLALAKRAGWLLPGWAAAGEIVKMPQGLVNILITQCPCIKMTLVTGQQRGSRCLWD